jgi:hypothetical protein
VDDEAGDETVSTPTATIPTIALPESVEESPELPSARSATTDIEQQDEDLQGAEEQHQPVLNTEVEEEEGAEEDIVRLERGLSTSTSCSFCVTGSPPMGVDESEIDPPEVDLGEEATSGEEDADATVVVGTDEASVIAAADRALDGVARVLDAIDDAADELRPSGAAEAPASSTGEDEVGAGSDEPPPFWETEQCGPPAPTDSSEGLEIQEEEGEEEEQYEDDDVEELPVAVVTR